jgi:hypothetical protein
MIEETKDFILACSAEISKEIEQEWQEIYHEELEKREITHNPVAVSSEKVVITITLDQDIAQIFNTSESINNALRHLLSAIP